MSQVIPLGPAARMLTTREAALRLGVSLRTVQLWVEADILPAARTPGGHRRIPHNAVEALALSTGLGGEPLARARLGRAELAQALATQLEAAEANSGRNPGPLDVLLVADDPAWQEACARALSPFGAAVRLRYAETGYLALLQIGQRAPDLLITHLRLPGMDGMVMLRTLERCEAMSHMHILALCSDEDLLQARRGGLPLCAEWVPLPVTADALAVRVGRCLLEPRTTAGEAT